MSDEIDLRDIRTLTERALARENPITRTQLYNFLARPDGPQGHPDIAGWRRLPKGARLIDTMPDGEIVWREQDTVVWDSGRRFDLPFKPEEDQSVCVNFILDDGTVVSHYRFLDRLSGNMDFPSALYIGANRVCDSSWNVSKLHDGTVAWSEQYTFFRWHPNGRLETKTIEQQQYHKFLLVGDGRVAGVDYGYYGYSSTNCQHALVALNDEKVPELVLPHGREFEDATYVDDGLYMLIFDHHHGCFVQDKNGQRIEILHRPKKGRCSIGSLTRLRDGRFAAIVGAYPTKRWQTSAGECPHFHRVSRIFTTKDGDFYHGQIDDQVFTMRIG